MIKFGIGPTFAKVEKITVMDIKNLKALKRGDQKVFSEVFNSWHKRVYRYFLKKCNDEFAARELTQQTFIKLWQYRNQISEELSLDQQLFQKARLQFIDWLRKEATYRKHFSTKEITESLQYAVPKKDRDFQEALSFLPPKRKIVFELKHIYGYSYREIAAYLNISVKTVDNHLLKASAQLRKVFNIPGIAIILITTF